MNSGSPVGHLVRLSLLALVLFVPFSSRDTRGDDAAAKPLLDFTQPRTIISLGDSVTGVYYHTGGVRAYPEMLEVAIKKAIPDAKVTVINAGISGTDTANALSRLDRDVLAKKPDLVTITYGLNDLTRIPIEKYQQNLKELITRCREAKAQVVLGTPNAVMDSGGRPTTKLEQYCEAIRATARELNVPVCDNYAAADRLRQKDAQAWRLTLSDAIHPNMDGHKLMAREFCKTITGKDANLDDVPPTPALSKVTAKLKKGEPIKVLAMPPFDGSIAAALKTLDPNGKFEVTPWKVDGQKLPEIDAFAKEKVRAMKPDLVIIAVPRTAAAATDEQFVSSFTWIMNWSLAFGYLEWDCLVVHPSVAEPEVKGPRDALTRQLVKAQDLWLIDRAEGDKTPAAELIRKWVEGHH